MVELKSYLEINKCPHCHIDKPSMTQQARIVSTTHAGKNQRWWSVYFCSRCGGAVIASSNKEGGTANEIYPKSQSVEDAIPDPAKSYLQQAIDTLHSPAGSVMLSASAVDAMLKAKNYKDGSLYSRINKASEDHLITADMAIWAHDIRLDANDPRHADDETPLPSSDDAERCVHFALALGEFLFVLPSKVKRGLEEAAKPQESS